PPGPEGGRPRDGAPGWGSAALSGSARGPRRAARLDRWVLARGPGPPAIRGRTRKERTVTEIRAATTSDALAYELRIEAPPRDVFAYWVDPQRMTRWMGKVATLDARPGGTFRLDYG